MGPLLQSQFASSMAHVAKAEQVRRAMI